MTVPGLGLAAAVVATLAIAILSGPAARAADLDPNARGGSPYDDPRYGDIYGYPPPPPRYAAPRTYEQAPPPPPPRTYRDDRGYLEPMPYPPGYYERRYAERAPRCLPSAEIHRSLFEQGWRGFEEAEPAGNFALVSAQWRDGRFYRLRVDRCTGEVVSARAIGGEPERPYAWRDRPGQRWY